MSWGEELWDRLDQVQVHTKKEIQDLENYARFIRERSEVEKEYAKNLRALLGRFWPKENKKDKTEESTQLKGFRLILKEIGFQANQHEALAETLAKTVFLAVNNKTKELSDQTAKYKKEARKLTEEKEKSEKTLEKSKLKYQRSFLDWEAAEGQYTRADTDKEVSRNEIDKLKKLSQSRLHQADEYKGQYARQLLRTNENQKEFYYNKLPAVINNFQSLDVARTVFVKEALSHCLQAERDIQPIIAKCHEEIANIIQNIDPVADTALVIDRLKTGNVPPPDFPFEEMKAGGELNYQTLHKKSRTNVNVRDENSNLFPKKRDLEKKIEALEAEILKGQNEIQGLQRMCQTYSQNPKFGDKKQFQGVLDTATYKVQQLESELHKYKVELTDVETRLENLRNRTPVDTPKALRRDESPSYSDKGSAGYGTISNSSGSEKDTDSLVGEKAPASALSDPSWDEDFHEDFEDLPPPPPTTVRALYDYTGGEEINLSMMAGEEFILLEGDADGWTKVQRLNSNKDDLMEVGFVPTGYLAWP